MRHFGLVLFALMHLWNVPKLHGSDHNTYPRYNKLKKVSTKKIKTSSLVTKKQVARELEASLSKRDKEWTSSFTNSEKHTLIIEATLLGALLIMIWFGLIYLLKKRKAERLIRIQNKRVSIFAQQLKLKNEQLSTLTIFKENLTGLITGDLKNSLNVILGLSSTEIFDSKMARINESGQNMLNSISNVLDVQRFKESRMPLHTQKVLAKDLFEQTKLRSELLLQLKSLDYKIICNDKMELHIDPDFFIRVMTNLINIAIKCSRVGQTIVLKAHSFFEGEDRYTQLALEYHGNGTESENIPFILNKLSQKKISSIEGSPSIILGMTYCKMAVEAHMGSILAESIPGKGTKMVIILPNDSIHDPLDDEEQTEFNDLNQNLILEDEKLVIIKYKSILSNYQVFQLGELYEILSRLENENLKSIWKKELKAAIYTGDQNKYDELVRTVE